MVSVDTIKGQKSAIATLGKFLPELSSYSYIKKRNLECVNFLQFLYPRVGRLPFPFVVRALKLRTSSVLGASKKPVAAVRNADE